jgi:hypothetical protein
MKPDSARRFRDAEVTVGLASFHLFDLLAIASPRSHTRSRRETTDDWVYETWHHASPDDAASVSRNLSGSPVGEERDRTVSPLKPPRR